MKKEVIKPFDLEKAKAGAKLRTRDGKPVEIFKWDTREDFPIKGMIKREGQDVNMYWTSEGFWCKNHVPHVLDLVIVEEVEEPKFKVGDWITNNKYIYRVLMIYSCYYFETCEGACTTRAIEEVDKNYHLWTIKDAKAGDILVDTEGSIFIFRKICGDYPNAYGGISTENHFESAYNSGCWTGKPCIPATKEQRRLLFKKMKEAGYKWNTDKLELKKKKPEFWSDSENNSLDGFIINDFNSDILKAVRLLNIKSNYDVFATKEQAKSALAMARISQIMANDIKNFGGVVTDEEWENAKYKFIIYREENSVCKTTVASDYYFLAFHTEKQRDLFLEKYPQLVKDFLMVSDK
jgi:hypothetical protein